MENLLSRRGFWVADILLAAGLFTFGACDMSTPNSSADAPPAATCTGIGQPCGSAGNLPCCGGASCRRGLCDATVACVRAGGGCQTSGDCCGSAACVPAGADRSVCGDGSCRGLGGACATSGDCCGALVCRSGSCLN